MRKVRDFYDFRRVCLKERVLGVEKDVKNDQKVRVFCLLESIASDYTKV